MFQKNMNSFVKQAQQMQQRMKKLQDDLYSREVVAQAGGGMVEAVVNGKGELLRLHLEKEIINPAEADMLTDLIVAAVGEAQHRAHEMMQAEMSKITGGINIPGLF